MTIDSFKHELKVSFERPMQTSLAVTSVHAITHGAILYGIFVLGSKLISFLKGKVLDSPTTVPFTSPFNNFLMAGASVLLYVTIANIAIKDTDEDDKFRNIDNYGDTFTHSPESWIPIAILMGLLGIGLYWNIFPHLYVPEVLRVSNTRTRTTF